MLALIYPGAPFPAFFSLKAAASIFLPLLLWIFESSLLVACNTQQETVTSFVLQKAVALLTQQYRMAPEER